MKRYLLVLKNISFEYEPDKEILSEINLSLKEGEIIGILGPSGVGKSSLLRLITGLEKPKTGEIFYNNETLCGCLLYTSPSPRDKTVSRMPSSA